ncbi:uncharacterized protein [Hemitrygon akajei]|uniref:uncharacterized protein isoform X2 n=1 Tax=Hemitrygon akajei TaxID=2704970 RepID=UPI003BF95ECF
MVSLYRIILDCELVYGSIEMGVPSEFRRTDVDVLLGNDLAGGRIWSTMTMTRRPVRVEAPPIASPSYTACAVTRSLSREAAEPESSLKLASFDLAATSLPTLCHEGLEGGKTRNSNIKGGKGEEIDLPLAKRKVLEVGNKDEKRKKLLKGPELDMDDLSGVAALFEEVESYQGVPDNEMKAVLDGKDVTTLERSAGLADKAVSARGVEFTPEGSCPERNWDDQGNLEFEKGTGIESLEEADVPFECVQDVDARGTEPSNGAQKKSEVFDSVEKECSPCGSDGLGSVKTGLTLVIGGREGSQVFVHEGVVNLKVELDHGGINIIIEGNGKFVVPKSNEKILNPAARLQSKSRAAGAPHAIVIQGCGVNRQHLTGCLEKAGSLVDLKLETNSMTGPEEKNSNLLKTKELGRNELGLGFGVDTRTPMNKVDGSLPCQTTRVPPVETHQKKGDG